MNLMRAHRMTPSFISEHPDVVARLMALAEDCRRDLGDAGSKIEGRGCRPVGRVENPKTRTSRDGMDPIIRAMYD
ncbi:MAG: hypothetical protein ACI9X0_000973 [Kiritimatiellia bacterium]